MTAINANALDQVLDTVGLMINLPLNNIVKALYVMVDTAEKRGFDAGYEAAEEDGHLIEHDAEEMYNDGYLDGVHDFATCPDMAWDRSNEIEDARLFVAANLLDETLGA